MNLFSGRRNFFARVCHIGIWVLICTLAVPMPLLTAASAKARPGSEHVLRRLEGPERQAAIAEAAREAFAQGEAFGGHDRNAENALGAAVSDSRITDRVPQMRDGGEGFAVQPEIGDTTRNGDISVMSPISSASPNSSAFRPQSVGEVLFNYGAGFIGVPGLAPHQGADGSFDEGLGFHQDGTARKAGGVTERAALPARPSGAAGPGPTCGPVCKTVMA